MRPYAAFINVKRLPRAVVSSQNHPQARAGLTFEEAGRQMAAGIILERKREQKVWPFLARRVWTWETGCGSTGWRGAGNEGPSFLKGANRWIDPIRKDKQGR
jgi:hypothetical protein